MSRRKARSNVIWKCVKTCQKAQCGQWRAVFVDRCLFGDEPMTRDMLRWLYTALTRATEKLYLVNFDPRFYE